MNNAGYYKDFLDISLFFVLTPVAIGRNLEVLEDVNVGMLPQSCIAS
jgi:hypothetical protein